MVASIKGCGQILRIDRSSGTDAVQWKLGGTSTVPDANTEFLEVTGDPAGEICGMHQVTLTPSGTVVAFDNGTHCFGPRKNEAPFSRVVEYDISSGTSARFMREYRRTNTHGYSAAKGGVTVLDDNGHWLITWGRTEDATAGVKESPSVFLSARSARPRHGSRLPDVVAQSSSCRHTRR